MRRKNQCYISVDNGFVDAFCGSLSDETLCVKYEVDPHETPCCIHSHADTSCTNPEARNEAATKLIKLLRKKYGVPR